MTYCHHCGKSVSNGDKFCPHCGALLQRAEYGDDDSRYEERKGQYEEAEVVDSGKKESSGKWLNSEAKSSLDLVIKVFMLIVTIVTGFAIIPLIWTVPMTMHAFRQADQKQPYGIAFSVCTIIFVSRVAGICMLVRDADTYVE